MAEEYPAAVTSDKHTLAGFEERRASVKGVDVRYFVAGAGDPPVVLVHGLGGAAANWVAVAPDLAKRHRVVVPDLPGHGGSAGVPGLPNLAPFAEIVHELARRESALPALFAGHSLGAVVAVRHAVRYPEETLGIVLAGAAGHPLDHTDGRGAPFVDGPRPARPAPRAVPRADRVERPAAHRGVRRVGRQRPRSARPGRRRRASR